MSALKICLLLMLALPGCQVIRDTANVSAVDTIVISGEARKAVSTIALSDFESLMLRNSENEYLAIRDKWKHKLSTVDLSGNEFSLLIYDYRILKQRYEAVDKIVVAHWDEYDRDTQYILTYFQAKAFQLNDSVDRMIAAGEKRKALLETLALVGIAFRVVAELK